MIIHYSFRLVLFNQTTLSAYHGSNLHAKMLIATLHSVGCPNLTTVIRPPLYSIFNFLCSHYSNIIILTSLWGSPAAENMGIFWPRAMLFMVSMAEIPVCIISSGYIRDQGLMGCPWISRKSSARIFGPLSFGFPEPLKTLPKNDMQSKFHMLAKAPHPGTLPLITDP